MPIELNLAIFPQTAEDHKKMRGDNYDPHKKYPEYSGVIKVPASQIAEIIKYLSKAVPDHDEYLGEGVVPLRAAGYMNTPKNNPNGKKFLGMKITADYKKQREIEERSLSGDSAASPATASPSTGNSNGGFDTF